MTTAETGRSYRFERFRMMEVLKDMSFSRSVPGPGDRVPDFNLLTLDGTTLSSPDLQEIGPALLVFGSLTCPMTDSAAPCINELYGNLGTGYASSWLQSGKVTPVRPCPNRRRWKRIWSMPGCCETSTVTGSRWRRIT